MQQIKKEAVMRGFALALAFLGVAATAEAASAAPAVTLSTTGNHPQGPVGVTGSGFGPGETVTFTFDTTQVLSLQADGTGAFSGKSLTVPTTAQPGTHTIGAVGATTGDTVTSKFLVITNWSEEGYGPEHTGSNPYENTLSINNVGSLSSAWATSPPILPTSPEIFSAGRLFLGAYQFRGTTKVSGLAKVQAATGYLAWLVQLGSLANNVVGTSPAVDGGVVYVGAADNKVYAVNGQTGAVIWSSATGATKKGISGAPIILGNLIYVGSLDANVYALNRATGSIIWKFQTTGGEVWSPAFLNGTLYVCAESKIGGNSYVYALNARTGAKIWSFEVIGDAIISAPKIADNKVYFGSYKGMAYALNATNGDLLWHRSFSSGVLAIAIDQNAYIMTESGNVSAVNPLNGLSVWDAAVPNSAVALSVDNGLVYVSAGDGNLYYFDSSSGKKVNSASIGYFSFPNGINVANGVVYIAEQQLLFALSLSAQ